MRAVWISLCLLLLVGGCSTWNFVYIQQTTAELSAMAEALPLATAESDYTALSFALDALKTRWNHVREYLAIGISRDTLSAVELALVEADVFCNAREATDYNAARRSLCLAIERISILERSFF